MYRLGLDWPLVTHLIMGPFGVVLLLGLRCVPFSYLAVSRRLAGLGRNSRTRPGCTARRGRRRCD